jgi:hypothetical protein
VKDLAEALRPLESELEEIEAGTIRVREALSQGAGAEAGVIGILNTVFEQAGLRLEFDPALAGEAAELERRRRREDDDDTLADVLRAYRSVTRLYPDILGAGYGGTPDDFEEFRRVVVNEVLTAAGAWASEHGSGSDAVAVSALTKRWATALG